MSNTIPPIKTVRHDLHSPRAFYMAVNLFDIQSNLQSLSINDEWSCSKCSFNNPLMAYPCCEMCEQIDSRLLQGFSITNQSIPTWECPRCTLKNLTISEQCTACGESKSISVYHLP
ncbi:unnamed protein product [Adineta steineri]|uniref:RanBP2-type domain-containing protein n=1 Tax=Adineta steineri TaxID=433720 RepID=A0A813MY24_9BILA|nr:unnamed protein product [Adineta steineri]